MKKKLTVCLPTYNRKEFIEKQICFFESEISDNQHLLRQVDFIVSDNSSTDGSIELLKKKQEENTQFKITFNQNNLGLVGNMIKLLNESKTEFVWFVSDDDTLRKGILMKAISILNNYPSINFVFLNYLTDGKKGFRGTCGYHHDSRNMALSLFREGYGSLLFMTSCLYKKENLEEISQNKIFNWLSAPLLYSFYSCSKGYSYVTDETWVTFRSGNASYAGLKRILKLKFEEYIPILESLKIYGYKSINITELVKDFLSKQSHSHFLYNFVNFKNSLRIYKQYYGLNTYLSLPTSILVYLKNKLK